MLVGEVQLHASRKNTRVAPGQLLDGRPHPLGESRIDRRRPLAGPLPRAGPFGPLLGRTHREAATHDLARQPAAALVVGNRENGSGVPLAQLPALHHPEHVVGKLQQPDTI